MKKIRKKDFVSPAFLASTAANEDRTELIAYCEEVEAASLSSTSGAMAATVFLGGSPPVVLVSMGGGGVVSRHPAVFACC